MPVANYRSTLGVYLDKTPTYLTAAVAASAVTLPVNGTVVPASSTVTIIDGPNTEQRAVTAGGGTSSLTVAALTFAHAANCPVVWQLTASVGPADYIPVTVLAPEDHINMFADKGLRGSAVDEYAAYQGTRFGTMNVTGDVFPDTFPYWVGNILGAVDFSAGTPNSHTFALKNTGTTQGTALGLYDFNAIDTRIMAQSKVDSLQTTIDPNGLMTYTASITGYMSGPTTVATSSYTAVAPAPSWLATVTVGGTSTINIRKGDITIKRPVSNQYTLQGIQDQYAIWQGPCSVTGNLDLVFEDNTQLNNFLNNSQPAVVITFTAAGANPLVVQFQMTKCSFRTVKNNQNDTAGLLTQAVSFVAEANTTDANTAGTGYSPVKVLCKNAKATGTFQ